MKRRTRFVAAVFAVIAAVMKKGSLDLKLVKDLRSNESDRIGFSSVILNGSDLIVCFNISGHEKTVFCPVKYDIQGSQEEAILLAEYAQSK